MRLVKVWVVGLNVVDNWMRPAGRPQPALVGRRSAQSQMVWEWCRWRRELVAAAAPNAGHYALVELETHLRQRGPAGVILKSLAAPR